MKDTLKTLSLLEENIDRLIENGIYEIERDLLLERLRGLYASVVATDAVAEEDRVLDALLSVGAVLPEEALEPEIEVERFFEEESPEVEEESAEEEIVEDVVEEPAEEEVTVVEETVPESVEEVVEEMAVVEPTPEPEPEPVAVEEEIDHAAVLSLYDDDDDDDDEESTEEEIIEEPEEESVEEVVEEEETPAPEMVDTPEEEEETVIEEDGELEEIVEMEPQKVFLGDILSSEQTTVADQLAEQMAASVATVAGVAVSLRESIGVNDKYILMRDLFAGDGDYYDRAITALDSFDSLDEAMLYIYDNYHWNPNCEGARLLMELLARKLY